MTIFIIGWICASAGAGFGFCLGAMMAHAADSSFPAEPRVTPLSAPPVFGKRK